MLLRFACSNFKSIKDKQEILFTAAKHVKELNDAPRDVEGFPKHRVLPAVALYGANASGKSNILQALAFLKRAVLRSHVDWEEGIDRKPFRLAPASKDTPSSFEIDFLLGGRRFHYGFVCDDKVVREEWLYVAAPRRPQQMWFHRKMGEEIDVGKPIGVLGEAIKRAQMDRDWALFLSNIVQSSNDMLRPVHEFFNDLVSFHDMDRRDFTTISLLVNEFHGDYVTDLMSSADVGIAGIDISIDIDTDRGDHKEIIRIKNIIPGIEPEDIGGQKKLEITSDQAKKLFEMPLRGGVKPIFRHMGDEQTVGLDWTDESRGTIRYFGIVGPIITTLRRGGILCVDELDSSLHTLLSHAIVRLFMNPETNPKGAQIIFTTHDTNLLTTDVLRRDQIWLTEKDREGKTRLYPLTDFITKPTTDIERAYLEGRFGGVPMLKRLLGSR